MAIDTPVEAPSPEKNPPRVNIELRQAEVAPLNKLKPGDKVRAVLTGDIVELSVREPYLESDQKYVGHLTLESYETEIIKVDSLADLADEDD